MQIKGRMAAGTAGAKGGRAEKGTARSFHGVTFYATSPPRAVPRAVGGGGHRARGAAWASCGILLRFAVFAVLAVATAAAAMGGGFMMAVREPEAVLAGGEARTPHRFQKQVHSAARFRPALVPRTRAPHSRPAVRSPPRRPSIPTSRPGFLSAPAATFGRLWHTRTRRHLGVRRASEWALRSGTETPRTDGGRGTSVWDTGPRAGLLCRTH